MIQRIQSVWLLMAAAFAFITFRFPFWIGGVLHTAGISNSTELNARTTILLTILTVLSGATAFATIFLFENRKLQLKICLLGLVFTALLLVAYFMQLKNFESGIFAISCIFHFGIVAFYILAFRGIRKDEKLIKSLDRLR